MTVGTFVRPTGRNVPSLFQSPRGVFKLQWTWAKSKFRDVFSLFIVKWTSPREKRWYNRTIKINRSQTAPTTIALHQEMYNAFAEGDARALRKICADGIHESFRARIGNRARGEKVVWELVKYNKRAKVMSDRAARLPMDGASIRQAVVRICSSQKLTRYLANGQQVKGTGKERDVVEYVVVQKKYWNYIGEQWQVWGTTEETTLDDVKEWETKSLADV
jgi:protein MBA1